MKPLALTLFAVLTSAALALTPHPFRTTSDDLLRRFHADSRSCPVPADPEHLCFTVRAATVVDVAEALEAYVLERRGAIERSPWQAANGAYSVALLMADRSWGKLELWLVERPGKLVEGRFEHHPLRRE